jgi:hypothetical protein
MRSNEMANDVLLQQVARMEPNPVETTRAILAV